VFCSNDLFENGSAVVYGKRKPWFELADESLLLHGVPVTQPFGARWSLLVRALHKLNREREFARAPRDLEAEWALERALSAQLKATAGPGVPLFIVSEVPDPDQSRAIVPGLIHIDVRAALDAGPTCFEHDPHWNAAGHAAVAACLRVALRTDAVD